MGSTKPDMAFFLRMCAGMSRIGCLELVSLEAGGKSVAMECHLIDGRALWSFKIAHDPAFAWYSPGTQLKYKVIDGFHERALDLADSCAVPENAHANRVWPDRRTMDTGWCRRAPGCGTGSRLRSGPGARLASSWRRSAPARPAKRPIPELAPRRSRGSRGGEGRLAGTNGIRAANRRRDGRTASIASFFT